MIKITDKYLCCGCNACSSICTKYCITMQVDNEGFFYPKVDFSECIDCHLCEKVCPVINQDDSRQPIEVFAANNTNDDIRLASSSGGIFTLLAELILDEGGVVFGARWDEEWNVIHDHVESKDELYKFRGSKYLQSYIGDSYSKVASVLKTGRKVLFTGTPCQIAGLKHYLRKEYDGLLTVEIICHSVPSPSVWQEYLAEQLEILKWKKSDIKSISFRNKNPSWEKYSFVIKHNDGSVFIELARKNAYMRGFLANLYNRPSCYQCPAKNLRSGSDITLGDYWSISTIFPDMNDKKGVSAIVVNTQKGIKYLQKVDSIKFRGSKWDHLCAMNPALINSVSVSPKRNMFFDVDYKLFRDKIKILCKRPLTFQRLVDDVLRLLNLR